MRSGHRSAHLWVVLASAILAACVLLYGWLAFSGRPEPEPLAPAGAEPEPLAAAGPETAEAGWAREPVGFPEAIPGDRP